MRRAIYMPMLDKDGDFRISCEVTLKVFCAVCAAEGVTTFGALRGTSMVLTAPDGWGHIVHNGYEEVLCPEHNQVVWYDQDPTRHIGGKVKDGDAHRE